MSPTAAEPTHSSKHHRRWGALLALAAVALVVLVATAFAGGPSSLTLGSASSSQLGKQVVVSPQGRTLYVLSPETSRHLLCKSKECLSDWPPLLVKSAKSTLKAGSGVKGKLGILKRSNGSFQVTLNGLPLYRYAGDSAKGQANGEGIKSFGGTWHAVKASGGSSTGSTTPAPSTPSMPAPEPEPAPYKS
jgi:predicted lipoprotein with Yx(FWY)xxD motif